MQLFYAPNITLPLYELPEEESAHSVRVLRLSEGDTIHLTDGHGNLYTAEIVSANPKRTTVKVVETIPGFEKRDYRLTIAVAPTKNIDRFEWFLEKATETGIDRIIPIECDHSERRTIKHDRQLRVITSAVKQSLKAYHPTLDEMTLLCDVLSQATLGGNFSGKEVAEGKFTDSEFSGEEFTSEKLTYDDFPEGKFSGKKLIAHCREDSEVGRKFIGDVLSKGDDALILIGPEGDFSAEEVSAALAAGFTPITLGNSRLRTETAALAAVTIASFINRI